MGTGTRKTIAAIAAGILLVLAAPAQWSNEPAPTAPFHLPPHTERVCPPPTPGYAACLSIVRTDTEPLFGVQPKSFTPEGLSPADLRSAYRLPSEAAGKGVTVAIVIAFHYPDLEQDLAVYRKQFGIKPCTTGNGCFSRFDQSGGTNYPVFDTLWGLEVVLDVQAVSAVCPRCNIMVVETDTNSLINLTIGVDRARLLGADVISNSWGAPEFPDQTILDPVYQQAIPIVAGSGDSGYNLHMWPATSNTVIAAGGTKLEPDPISARGWKESAWAGAGSGCSAYEGKGSWQTDPLCGGFRTVADVSALADPDTGFAIYYSELDGWGTVGGTSLAAPIVASVYALAAPADPTTWATSWPYASIDEMNDVTTGSNGSCGATPICTAVAGFDGPTGLGTPNGPWAFMSEPPDHVPGDSYSARKGCKVTDRPDDHVRIACAAGKAGSITWAFDPGTAESFGIHFWKYSTAQCKATVASAPFEGGGLGVTLKLKKLSRANACEISDAWLRYA